jgi:hypothetical protein
MTEPVKEVTMYISPKINSRIMEYAQAATGEISGFGSINPHTGIIDKLFPLMEQFCSGSETEISPEMITKFVESGQSATANIWWHSHVHMGCFWSPTDEDCIKALGSTMTSLLSIVVNKRREYEARFDLFKPVRFTLKVKLMFYYEFPYSEIEKIRSEVKDKVKPIKVKSSIVVYDKNDRPRVDLHGMDEVELNQYGYKVVGNNIVKMSKEEITEFWKKYTYRRNKHNGSEQSGTKSLFDVDGDDFPPRGIDDSFGRT